MELETELNPLPGFPAPTGAHELAWSYLLDYVFADAYHHGVSRLRVILPHEGLLEGLQMRADLTPTAPGGKTAGVLLAPGTPAKADRVYTVRFGPLAPAGLRNVRISAPAGTLEEQLFVYTWRSFLLGLGMRLPNPALSNRAWLGVRQHFASRRPTPSFYQLSTWSPA